MPWRKAINYLIYWPGPSVCHCCKALWDCYDLTTDTTHLHHSVEHLNIIGLIVNHVPHTGNVVTRYIYKRYVKWATTQVGSNLIRYGAFIKRILNNSIGIHSFSVVYYIRVQEFLWKSMWVPSLSQCMDVGDTSIDQCDSIYSRLKNLEDLVGIVGWVLNSTGYACRVS